MIELSERIAISQGSQASLSYNADELDVDLHVSLRSSRVVVQDLLEELGKCWCVSILLRDACGLILDDLSGKCRRW